jgi:hypothetical protein
MSGSSQSRGPRCFFGTKRCGTLIDDKIDGKIDDKEEV